MNFNSNLEPHMSANCTKKLSLSNFPKKRGGYPSLVEDHLTPLSFSKPE
jgi:hypothetical protein